MCSMIYTIWLMTVVFCLKRFLKNVFLLCMPGSFACKFVCAPLVCLVPVEDRHGPFVSWNWSYRRCELPWYWALNLGPLQKRQRTWPLSQLQSLEGSLCLLRDGCFWLSLVPSLGWQVKVCLFPSSETVGLRSVWSYELNPKIWE